MKIAIVDDSAFSRSQLKKAFTKYYGDNLELNIYSNGSDALKEIPQLSLDLVTLDLVMPEPTGFKVLKALKAEGVEAPILIASADIQKSTKDICLADGCAGFLEKPFTADKVAETLRDLGL